MQVRHSTASQARGKAGGRPSQPRPFMHTSKLAGTIASKLAGTIASKPQRAGTAGSPTPGDIQGLGDCQGSQPPPPPPPPPLSSKSRPPPTQQQVKVGGWRLGAGFTSGSADFPPCASPCAELERTQLGWGGGVLHGKEATTACPAPSPRLHRCSREAAQQGFEGWHRAHLRSGPSHRRRLHRLGSQFCGGAATAAASLRAAAAALWRRMAWPRAWGRVSETAWGRAWGRVWARAWARAWVQGSCRWGWGRCPAGAAAAAASAWAGQAWQAAPQCLHMRRAE